jgi:AraC family transcriptional regulator, arabinose operon regulatory protein
MDRRIKLAINTIESNLDRDCDSTTLSRVVRLSPSRLRHLFKEETGTTLAQFVRELRLKRAEGLLRTTFLTIKEVANQVGIKSVNHFTRDFRKAYGMTPANYRTLVAIHNEKNE